MGTNYPLADSLLEHQTFNKFSHLYKWAGSDTSLEPMILASHIDVVPIASLRKWTVHPFTEGVKNDTIYGRGTMDDKFGVIGIMEAVGNSLVTEAKKVEYLAAVEAAAQPEAGVELAIIEGLTALVSL